MDESAIRAGYGGDSGPGAHPTGRRPQVPGTVGAVVVAGAVVLAVASRDPWVPVVGAVVVLVTSRRIAFAAVVVVLGGLGVHRSDAAWRELEPDRLGPFHGWVTVVEEPRRAGPATNVILDVDGERFEVWVRGRAGQLRAATWRGGERLLVAGVRVAVEPDRRTRVAWRHVVGRLEVDWFGDVAEGGPLARSSNRVRALIARGAAALPAADAALTRGLVVGDDRDQPPDMVERFRVSGLAHLTAVSGQNVCFILAAAGPVLRRGRPFTRWVGSLTLIGWFVVVTRAEPSVLRAGAMAALAATAFALGRPTAPVRLLAVAVTGLVLVDPLLEWSIGFWLSVGATFGVTALGPPLARRLTVLGPLALPVGVTLGAQAGVAVPSVLVFGRLSLVGTAANILAVPVAGFVMLYGLPACLVAGALPAVAPVVMAPVGVAVRWVDAVATVGAHAEPGAPWSWLGWILLAVAVTAVAWGRRHHHEGGRESGAR